jgi:hypothetical protein
MTSGIRSWRIVTKSLDTLFIAVAPRGECFSNYNGCLAFVAVNIDRFMDYKTHIGILETSGWQDEKWGQIWTVHEDLMRIRNATILQFKPLLCFVLTMVTCDTDSCDPQIVAFEHDNEYESFRHSRRKAASWTLYCFWASELTVVWVRIRSRRIRRSTSSLAALMFRLWSSVFVFVHVTTLRRI